MQHPFPARLLELIDDSRVSDILLAAGQTQVDYGDGLVSESAIFTGDIEIANFARELIELGGRRLDQANPFADASLPGGLRVHAVLASACSTKTMLSIRLHSQEGISLQQMLEKDFLNESQLALLRQILKEGQSFLICGATASGKTTLLRAMLAEVSERIIAVEDVSELASDGVISLQTRNPNIENQGEITLDRLVREALRMRPDRIVVGEVRGRELITMLQALNTGHRGAATIHASELAKVPERLYAIATEIDPDQLALMAKAAFDWVIALRSVNGKRGLAQIGRFHLEGKRLQIREQIFDPVRSLN